ncbi:MAG: M56 family metallopeptidase [Lachnospiraceae bacterium]|nr:M56 family metallopeptidase [Lachnospiraceae bacterium]
MADIFLKFFNTGISAGWLILVILLFRWLFPKMPKWLRPAFWGLVGLRLILLVSIPSVLSLIPSAQTVSPEIMYSPEPTIHSGLGILNTMVNPKIIRTFAPKPGDSANPLQILIPFIAALWLLGVVLMFVAAGISYLRLHRRLRTAILIKDNIYQSENVFSPFVFGLFHPRIYLPFGMDDKLMENVLLHEKAHIARHDHLGKILGYLLLCLYWFQPLCWVAYLLLCRDIEFACDERVIRKFGRQERADYSQALLILGVSRPGVHICPLAFGEIGVKTRVRNVLNYRKPVFWVVGVAVTAFIIMAVCFLTNPEQGSGMTQNVNGLECWFDKMNPDSEENWSGSLEMHLAKFPGVTFRASHTKVEAVTEEGVTELFLGMPIWNVYVTDLSGDGLPELCATVSYGSGIIDEHIIVYDYAKGESYTLWERGENNYVLKMEDGKLRVCRTKYQDPQEGVEGSLWLVTGEDGRRWLEMIELPENGNQNPLLTGNL